MADPVSRDAVESVIKNPYLQYFPGFKSFQTKAPFSASLLTHSRKRLPGEVVMSLNDRIIESAQKSGSQEEDHPPDGDCMNNATTGIDAPPDETRNRPQTSGCEALKLYCSSDSGLCFS